MTVITWDGKTLAADKRATGGTIGVVTKILRTADGRLIGMSGNGSIARELAHWAAEGEDSAKWPSSADQNEATLMVIERGKPLRVYHSRPYPMCPETSYFAIGAGEAYAMTAMHLGLGARSAVEVACELHESCGNGIDTLELEPP